MSFARMSKPYCINASSLSTLRTMPFELALEVNTVTWRFSPSAMA